MVEFEVFLPGQQVPVDLQTYARFMASGGHSGDGSQSAHYVCLDGTTKDGAPIHVEVIKTPVA